MPAPGSVHKERQALSHEKVVSILDVVSVTAWLTSILLAAYTLIRLGYEPPKGPNDETEITCEHVLPTLLHLAFAYLIYKLHTALWNRHHRKLYFDQHGIDLEQVEAHRKRQSNSEKGFVSGVVGLKAARLTRPRRARPAPLRKTDLSARGGYKAKVGPEAGLAQARTASSRMGITSGTAG